MKATKKIRNFMTKRKTIHLEKNIYKFNSLDVLSKIIKNEKEFKVQIITLETLDTFISFLNIHQVEYDTKDENKNKISLLLENKESKNKRIILFSNKRNSDYLQIVFKPENEEKLRILDKKKSRDCKKIVDAFPYKNIEELRAIKDNYNLNIQEIMKDSFDYLESLILFSILRNNRLEDIVKNIRTLDDKIDNPFMIICKLNSLVNRNVLTRNRNIYKLNISLGVLESICKRTDLDINKL